MYTDFMNYCGGVGQDGELHSNRKFIMLLPLMILATLGIVLVAVVIGFRDCDPIFNYIDM